LRRDARVRNLGGLHARDISHDLEGVVKSKARQREIKGYGVDNRLFINAVFWILRTGAP
jgi:hypothetical protein